MHIVTTQCFAEPPWACALTASPIGLRDPEYTTKRLHLAVWHLGMYWKGYRSCITALACATAEVSLGGGQHRRFAYPFQVSMQMDFHKTLYKLLVPVSRGGGKCPFAPTCRRPCVLGW